MHGLEAFNRVAGGGREGKSHEMFPIFAEEIPDTRKFSSRCVLKTKVFIVYFFIFDGYNQPWINHGYNQRKPCHIVKYIIDFPIFLSTLFTLLVAMLLSWHKYRGRAHTRQDIVSDNSFFASEFILRFINKQNPQTFCFVLIFSYKQQKHKVSCLLILRFPAKPYTL